MLITLLIGIGLTISCNSDSSSSNSSSDNPSQVTNIEKGEYDANNLSKYVCFKDMNYKASAEITDANGGIKEVYARIGSNNWVPATKSENIYSISLPEEQYLSVTEIAANGGGSPTIDLLVIDDEDNEYETSFEGNIYMNSTDIHKNSSEDLMLYFENDGRIRSPTVGHYPTNEEDIQCFTEVSEGDNNYYFLIPGSTTDVGNIPSFLETNYNRAFDAIKNLDEIEEQLDNMDLQNI